MRADMYGRLGAHPELARAVAANQVLLGAMSDDELERAVTEPARLAGLRLEPGLVELVLRDVAGEPGALPLLSHALRATWERRDGRTLTVEGYRESGGVASAVARTADGLLDALPRRAAASSMRSVFLRLTELGDGSAETRRRVPDRRAGARGRRRPRSSQALLERLADARLVTLGEGTAEVAHEVLIREWPTLRGWLEEDREGIRLHRQLGRCRAHVGGRRPRAVGPVPRRPAGRRGRLGRAPSRASSTPPSAASSTPSVQEADRERRAQLRANRRLRALLAGAVVLLAVAVLAGVVALIQRQRRRRRRRSPPTPSGSARRRQTEPDLDRRLLLAVAAVKLQDRAETRSDLLAALQRNPALIRLLRPSDNRRCPRSVSAPTAGCSRRRPVGSGSLHRPRAPGSRRRGRPPANPSRRWR